MLELGFGSGLKLRVSVRARVRCITPSKSQRIIVHSLLNRDG